MPLSKSLASRIGQVTGASVQWLLAADPDQSILNQKNEPYSLDDFLVSYVQFEQFSFSKESSLVESLQLLSQIRAVEIEELLNRAIQRNQFPLVRIMLDNFRDEVLRIIGEPEGKMRFDLDKAAMTFSARHEHLAQQSRAPGKLNKIVEDAAQMIRKGKVYLNPRVVTKVLKQYRSTPKEFWDPLFVALRTRDTTSSA